MSDLVSELEGMLRSAEAAEERAVADRKKAQALLAAARDIKVEVIPPGNIGDALKFVVSIPDPALGMDPQAVLERCMLALRSTIGFTLRQHMRPR